MLQCLANLGARRPTVDNSEGRQRWEFTRRVGQRRTFAEKQRLKIRRALNFALPVESKLRETSRQRLANQALRPTAFVEEARRGLAEHLDDIRIPEWMKDAHADPLPYLVLLLCFPRGKSVLQSGPQFSDV